jgi:hypothetical protein
MNLKMQKAQVHQVTYVKTKGNNVILGDDVKKFVVRSEQKRVAVHLYSKSTGSVNKFGACTIFRKRAASSCNKTRLLHRPCSHVVAVSSQIAVSTSTYMSAYYNLSYIGNTWSRKFDVANDLFRYRKCIQFGWKEMPTWILDKKLECGFPSFLTSDCTQTATEDEEQE